MIKDIGIVRNGTTRSMGSLKILGIVRNDVVIWNR